MPDLAEAACRSVDPEIFFGPHVCNDKCDGERGCYIGREEKFRMQRIQLAKRICMGCPERLRCLLWALETRVPFGVWGATTEGDRRKIRLGIKGLE